MTEIPEHLLYGLHWTLIEVKDFVGHCFERDALLMTLLNYGSEWLQGRLICVVSHDYVQPFMARGWASWGDDAETTAEMSGVKLPKNESVVLEHIIDEGTYTIGAPAKVGFKKLFDETPVMEPDELVIIPLQLGGSTKMLMVGEPRKAPEDLLAFSQDIQPLIEVADEVAQQLEVIIKLAKARQLPSPQDRIPPLPARIAGRQLSDVYKEDSDSSISVEEELANQRSLMEAVSTALQAGDSSMSSALFSTMKPHVDAGRVSDQEEDAAPGSEIQQTPRTRKTLPLKIDTRSTSRHVPLTGDQVQEDRDQRVSTTSVTGQPSVPPFSEQKKDVPRLGLEPDPEPTPKRVDVGVLPSLSPFDTDYGSQKPIRPRPVPMEPEQETEDDPGVNIIAPIGLQNSPMTKQTLMGGYSMADLERAKAEFEKERRDPLKPSNTLNGIQAPITATPPKDPQEKTEDKKGIPAAGILKRSRKKTNPAEQANEEPPENVATVLLPAVSRDEPPKDADTQDVSRETPAPTEEVEDAPEPAAIEESAEDSVPEADPAATDQLTPLVQDNSPAEDIPVGATLLMVGAIDRETGEQSQPVQEEDESVPSLAAAEADGEESGPKATIPMQAIPQLEEVAKEDGEITEPSEALEELSEPATLQGLPEADPEMLGDFARSSGEDDEIDLSLGSYPEHEQDASEDEVVVEGEGEQAEQHDHKSTIPMQAIPQLQPEGEESVAQEQAQTQEPEQGPTPEDLGQLAAQPDRKATMLMGSIDRSAPQPEDENQDEEQVDEEALATPRATPVAKEQEDASEPDAPQTDDAAIEEDDDAADAPQEELAAQSPAETDIPQGKPAPKSTMPLVSPDISQEIAAEAAALSSASLADALEGGAEKMQADGVAVSDDAFATRVMPAIKTEPLTAEQKKALEDIDSRDLRASMDAAEKLIAHPEVFKRLESLFPGRLYVDRYQWTPQKFPPAERHGPVIKAVLLLGADAEPLLVKMLDHTGLDHRFYATFLLERLDTADAMEGLRERIFDRDIQTRTLAMRALLKRAHAKEFRQKVLEPLREELRHPTDELHAEQAGEFLGLAKDVHSIEPLIEALDMHRGKVQRTLHESLQRVTLQPLPPASIAWRTWYLGAKQEQRSTWVLRALNSPNDRIRELVVDDVEKLEADHKLVLGYHPDQPARLRTRAQQQLREWYSQHNML